MSTTRLPQVSLPTCDHQPAAYDGPSREQVIAMRHQYVNPGVLTYYRDPLMIVEGNMQYVWDETGKRYLDAFAGIVTVSVGHCHPTVAEAVQKLDTISGACDTLEGRPCRVTGRRGALQLHVAHRVGTLEPHRLVQGCVDAIGTHF